MTDSDSRYICPRVSKVVHSLMSTAVFPASLKEGSTTWIFKETST